MTAVDCVSEPSQRESAGTPVANATMISCVESATSTTTSHFGAGEIIGAIRADTHFNLMGPIAAIREKFWRVMTSTNNDRKKAKSAISGRKTGLPGALWSGTFRVRKGSALMEHSGLLCADLDGLGKQMAEVRPKLLSSPHLWALFLSPTGDGLKCVFRVQADEGRHRASFRAVEDHVRTLCGIQIDESCSDVGRLCFLSHDPDAYLNEAATELPPTVEAEDSPASKPESETPVADSIPANGPPLEIRREIAIKLLGPIAWNVPSEGYCTCPGEGFHTGDNGARDCRVNLDGTPTVHCFHQSCKGLREAVNRELRSLIGRAEYRLGGTPSSFPKNDSDRAARFAERFAHELRYVSSWKSWLLWDGTRWVRDEGGAVMRKAQEMSEVFLAEAIAIEDMDQRKRAAGYALRAGDAAKLKAMIELAGSQAGIAATPQLFDSDPCLLGVLNGVVDLQSGTFRTGRQDDYLTKRAGTEYVEGATCPNWNAFLRDIFAADESLIAFIQDAIGYSLTGLTREQVLFFLYGTGRNGKSTLTETVLTLLRDYGQHAPAALFVANHHGNEPEKEIARLMGVRFVVGSEIEEGSKFAESRVKDITGQDTLTGRFIYGSPFDFKPALKLFVFGNHKPDIRGTDKGIWRRMLLIPFLVQIEESKIDRQLQTKLRAELPGILNWAIAGCLRWQRNGLQVPLSVRRATDEYQDEEDELGEFISDRCLLGPDNQVTRASLHHDYLGWAGARGTRMPLKHKAFTKSIRSRQGITEGKSGVSLWRGIGLKPDPNEPHVSKTPDGVRVDFPPFTRGGADG